MGACAAESRFLERKVENDLKDVRKTLVGFANSLDEGETAVLLIGERDDGTAQGLRNVDGVQKTVRKEADAIYPPISYVISVYEKDGCSCVRVEVGFDGNAPHFGGPAWIRRGSETVLATDEMFQRLIELRTGKHRQLLKWVGMAVTVVSDMESVTETRNGRWPYWMARNDEIFLRDVNAFIVTFEVNEPHRERRMRTEPLSKITLAWDDQKNRPRLYVRQ